MRLILFSFFFISCGLSNETRLREECDKEKSKTYLYMIPILDRYAANVDRTQATSTYIINAEITDQRCRSEAKKNELNLRSN